MATFSIHFDGPITTDHKVSIRVLSKTYEHMQRSIDRAYLINKYGAVWKHARLKEIDYIETEFIAEYPREGGIILDAIKNGAGRAIDRIAEAVIPVFDNAVNRGFAQHDDISRQQQQRLQYVQAMERNTPTFEALLADPPEIWASAYSNRSIVKEIDQLVNQIAPDRLDGSTVELTLNGERAHLPLLFDAQRAKNFHKIASLRELGAPLIANVIIRSLDRGNKHTKPSAKILNLATNREVALRIRSIEDFDELHPYHKGNPVELYVCPIIESLGFDVYGGDLIFLSVV